MQKWYYIVLSTCFSHSSFASGVIEMPREPAHCQELRTQLESWEKKARRGTGGQVEIRTDIDEKTQYREKRQQAEYVDEQIRDLKKELFNQGCAAWEG